MVTNPPLIEYQSVFIEKFLWTHALFDGPNPSFDWSFDSSVILDFVDVNFYKNNSLPWRASTVWSWWLRNVYILLDFLPIELYECNSISTKSSYVENPSTPIMIHTCMYIVVSSSSVSSIHAQIAIRMFMKHLCIVINTLVAFEIAPAINMNANKLNKQKIILNITHCL